MYYFAKVSLLWENYQSQKHFHWKEISMYNGEENGLTKIEPYFRLTYKSLKEKNRKRNICYFLHESYC